MPPGNFSAKVTKMHHSDAPVSFLSSGALSLKQGVSRGKVEQHARKTPRNTRWVGIANSKHINICWLQHTCDCVANGETRLQSSKISTTIPI